MELIKKKAYLITTTATTFNGEIVEIPDTSVNYSFKLLLPMTSDDLGFFDTYEDEDSNASGSTIPNQTYTITGQSTSRLEELKKFSTSTALDTGYFNSTDPSVDGVDITLSNTGQTVYYLGGITYSDLLTEDTTIFSFISSGNNSPDIDNKPYIKDNAKENTVAKPEVSNNVFIIRQSLSVFDNFYRLADINNLSELEAYAGGQHFNIVNNT